MPTYSVVAPDGQMYGPADELAMGEWIRQGRVNQQTMLHCHETNARVAAGMVPALQPALGLSQQQVDHLLHGPAQGYAQPQQAYAAPQAGYAAPQAGYAQPYGAAPMAYATPGAMSYGGPAQHQLTEFSTAAAVLCCMFVPLFGMIYYGMVHGKLPQRRPDDPSTGKAIGFMFIPFFNYYWICFFWVRLCTRINDERGRVGLPPTAPRGLVIASLWCLLGAIVPLIGIVSVLAAVVMLVIAVGQLQGSINELVRATRQPQMA